MLLQQAQATQARRNKVGKNSMKLSRRRDTRSYPTVAKINAHTT